MSASNMSPEELSRYIHASSWRKVQETIELIKRSVDPRAELVRITPLICHPRIDHGSLPPLLEHLVECEVRARAREPQTSH